MTRPAVLWVGGASFAVLCAWCAAYSIPRIESALESRSAVVLLAADLPLDQIIFDGRDATLVRSLAGVEYADRAVALLRTVPGIRTVTVGPAEAEAEQP